jgi:D-3-phosphoglycerate dehydrogenase / 2-oxoglutarate reductase
MSTKPIVLLTNPIHPDGAAILSPHALLLTAPDTKAETLRSHVTDVAGIIVRAKLPNDIVDHAPKLKGIVRHGVGLDFIPVKAAVARGVAVANLPGSNTQAVAEYCISALLQLRRPLQRMDHTMRSRGWAPARALAEQFSELSGSRLGILGVGAVGRRVAEIAHDGFGMNVSGTSRKRGTLPPFVEQVSLETLFNENDALVISCALTEETRGVVSAAMIARMRRHSVLINVSRGPVVDTAAIIAALKDNRMAGASLDVFDQQPLPDDHPVLGCPNLLLTPHVAGITASSSRAMSIGAAREMIRILNGQQPVNSVS